MHKSIRSELEDLLEGKSVPSAAAHLASCGDCTGTLRAMQSQKNLFGSLRADSDFEPAAGFYARVLQRIEERKESIWAVFVDSPFGTRLAFASLSLAVLIGSYVVAQETRDGHLLSQPVTVAQHYDIPVVGDQAQLRDAVLQNFAAHHSLDHH